MKYSLFLSVTTVTASTFLFAYLCADRLDDRTFLPPNDFLEYWAAGRATLAGDNPYDGQVVMPMQASMVKVLNVPVIMWNPPWALPITFVVSWMPLRLGQFVWLVMNLLCVICSTITLWRLYGGSRNEHQLMLNIGVLFLPTFFLLDSGQISGIVLAGIVGFLACVQSERWILAGIFGSLTAMKPHLLTPFAAILVVEAIRGTQIRKTVIAGICTLAILSLIPLIWNQYIWSDYLTALQTPTSDRHLTLREWIHPTLGYAIRSVWPGQPFRVMFLPLLIGLPLVVARYWRNRANWNWLEEFPALMVVSLLLAPYGSWAFDMILLLVFVIAYAVRWTRTMNANTAIYLSRAYGAVNILVWFGLSFLHLQTKR